MEEKVKTNELVKVEGYKSALAKQTETYTNMMVSTFKNINVEYTEYQKICVANMIAKMSEILTSKEMTFKDIDSGNITSILSKCSMLKLNIAAVPAECYLQLRNVKIGEVWTKQFEFGVEGNGNDAILRNYGVNVKEIRNAWLVREGDEFSYPSFDGLKVNPPKWSPHSYTGKVIRVVYPVIKNDGNVDWLISEREDVAKNLKAHIAQNLLASDFKSIRQSVIDKINNMTLDEMLNDESLKNYISPSWLNASSREDMILRKMKNNATKKYPKNFENAFVSSAYESTYEDYDQYKKQEFTEEIDMTEKLEEEIEANVGSEQLNTAYEAESGELIKETELEKEKVASSTRRPGF